MTSPQPPSSPSAEPAPRPEPKPCLFCSLPASAAVARNATGYVLRDRFPVSPGHSLVIPHRHVLTLHELTADERLGLLDLLDATRAQLQAELQPDGFNIGINEGLAGGQSVMHLHIHLMPRFLGDVPDPQGGVRWVIPDKADYWTPR